ncbi:MAG: glycosyltransferase family 2 protein [Gaiellaceae bacterium]
MKLVMTLLARDEADVIESWLAFHLNAGADLVIATDNRSEDGTTEILERYARDGFVHLIHEPGEDLRQNEWVTRMARLAATDFGADWVINSDADEFWWPRGASLRDMLAAVPPRYGTVGAFLRMFVPRPGSEEPFERMTIRFSALAPINDPASLYKPIRKVVHRAHPEITLARGNHALVDSPFAPLRGWFPVEVFHFPLRSLEQCTHKAALQGNAFEKYISRPPTAYHATMFEALRSGRLEEYYGSLVVGDDEVERGVAAGRLVVDTRLRDALRQLRGEDGEYAARPSAATALSFPIPSLVEDAEYAVEAAVLGEADVVRLQRRLDTLERRLLTLELRLPTRVYRKLSRTAKKALRREAP